MFGQSKSQPMPLLFPSQMAAQKQKPAKSLTPEEQYEQAIVTARVFIDHSRTRVGKEMEKYSAVMNSNYWYYGYFGANMMTAMAACLGLGGRIPFFRSYSGWIAMAGGYFGGKLCMNVHLSYLLSRVVKRIDHEIDESKRMDERTDHSIPDYLEEANRLRKMKYELKPTLPEAVAAHADSHGQTLDERADALVNAYLLRRQALNKKT